MHSLLNTIGFSDVDGLEDEEKLIKLAIKDADTKKVVKLSDKRSAVELFMPVAENTGVVVRGEYNEKGELIVDHYFPSHFSKNESLRDYLVINKRMDSDAFTIMCDDNRLGVTIIFYLQNKADMLIKNIAPNTDKKHPVFLSALAHEGKILLPTMTVNVPEKVGVQQTPGPKGLPDDMPDEEKDFFNDRAFAEIEQYAQVRKRSEKEDVYSIVDTCFYPCGSESDNYSILGKIKNVDSLINKYTREELYVLLIDCNGLDLEICVNKKDLFGEPLPGRRFKGNIWLQGSVKFDDSIE